VTAVELKLVGREFQRPPLVDLVFDVVLRNATSQPRWFLLPSAVGPGAEAVGSAGVSSAEIVRIPGAGSAVVGRFSGNAAFDAVLLPPGGELSLYDWPISLWDDPPVGEIDLDVVTAADFTIDGESARAWFGTDPLGELSAEVSRRAAVTLATRINEQLAAAPVALVDEQRERVHVTFSG
jgi:hypothetical protein